MTELKIATDVVAFGSINCREVFEKEYFPALQKQFSRPAGEVKIEVVNFSHEKKARLAALQFPNDEVKQEKALEIEKQRMDVLQSLCNANQRKNPFVEIEKGMPIYIWIADNEEAVFATEKITKKDGGVETNEIGFKMQGAVAIAFLNILFDEYKMP